MKMSLRYLMSGAVLRQTCRWYSIQHVNEQLHVHEQDGLRTITLSSPKTRNALSLSVLEGLESAITKESSTLRCIVLAAQGKVFSAGHNLKELTSKDGQEYHTKVFDTCSRLMLTLQNIPVPIIAQVNGIATAAGCQLVASCDIVIATPNSTFSTPGGSVGIFCSTPGIPLVRNVPRKVAAHMLLTGLPITAMEALQAGLVSKVVPEEDIEAETERMVKAIISKSKSVIALGKKFMYHQMEMDIASAYREGSCVMVNNINMVDGQEGINSFIGKRKPVWTHSDE
ncbi:enoyl-CoA hydratase domain-containing protein 3, mitochondrial-like [Oratosquilla oratoria]|uniref:enoyl-CoA hydratase domain-containing protein 3, mitochondrial-like n=1 Tax=Oratosquilla oratoria TaxID=337810 RepID=UPI003F760A52